MTEYIKPITETPKLSHYPDTVSITQEPTIIARKYTNSTKTSYMEIPIPISFITSMSITVSPSGKVGYEITYNLNKYKKDKKDRILSASDNDFECLFVDENTFNKVNAIWRGQTDNKTDTQDNNCHC